MVSVLSMMLDVSKTQYMVYTHSRKNLHATVDIDDVCCHVNKKICKKVSCVSMRHAFVVFEDLDVQLLYLSYFDILEHDMCI